MLNNTPFDGRIVRNVVDKTVARFGRLLKARENSSVTRSALGLAIVLMSLDAGLQAKLQGPPSTLAR